MHAVYSMIGAFWAGRGLRFNLSRCIFFLRHRQPVPTIDGMSLQTKCIGVRQFVDGSLRPIFEDPTGRQFVTDGELTTSCRSCAAAPKPPTTSKASATAATRSKAT
jgi:hypothetical protein